MLVSSEEESDGYEHAPLATAFAQSMSDLCTPITAISSFSEYLQTFGVRPETRAFGTAIRRLAGAFAYEWIWGTFFPYMGWLEKDFPNSFDFGPSQFRPASFERPYGRTLLGIITEMEQRIVMLLQRIEAYIQASTSWTTDDELALLTVIQRATLQLQAVLTHIRAVLVDRVIELCDS